MGFIIRNGVLTRYESEWSLRNVIIPDGVTKIAGNAFRNCYNIISVSIPDSVTCIGRMAFAGCTLNTIVIPDSITDIGEEVFFGSGLQSVTIPDSVTSIGEGAFKECKNLKKITLSNHVTSIGMEAFWASGLTTVTIPGSVTSIEEGAFMNCEDLKIITISEGVTSIEGRAFKKCSNLRTVNIAGSVTSIGKEAFGSCPSLSAVVIDGKLFILLKHGCDVWDTNRKIKLIFDKDYTLSMNPDVKYDLMVQMFHADMDKDGIFSYVEEHFSSVFSFLVENGYMDAVQYIINHSELLTSQNIDQFLQLAITSRQTEIFALLLAYKHEKIGFMDIDEQFSL